MEVTRANASLVLDDFVQELEKCEFCAVDQEMTGVDVPGCPTESNTPPEDVYRAKRLACEAYSVIQFGIALFTKVPNGNYEVRPYNFYLLKGDGDLRLSMSAISFLAKHQMNFQTWLTSGMPYWTAAGEATCTEEENAPRRPYTPDEQENIAKLIAKIVHWYESEKEDEENETTHIDAQVGFGVALGVKNHFQRHDNIQIDIHFDVMEDKTIRFVAHRLHGEAWETVRAAREERRQKARMARLGFRVFWKAICESKKPIVGHNFLQDLMFMIHMNEKELPEDYNEFKRDVQNCLPCIFDTKTLASDIGDGTLFAQTHLEFLFNACRERAGWNTTTTLSKYFRLPPGFYAYDESQLRTSRRAHEGAYDAYMTGIVFIYFQNNYKQETLSNLNVIAAYGSSYRHHMSGDDRIVPDPRTNNVSTTQGNSA